MFPNRLDKGRFWPWQGATFTGTGHADNFERYNRNNTFVVLPMREKRQSFTETGVSIFDSNRDNNKVQ